MSESNIAYIAEYINIMHRTRILNDIMSKAAYRWIEENIGIVSSLNENENNIGKAYCKFRPNDLNIGFDWKFDSWKHPSKIIITYSTIRNEYAAIKEDNEAIVSFEEFEKYI